MRLMSDEINLTRAKQIIVVELEYISYAAEKAEERITKIGQLNHTSAHILVCTMSKLSGE